MFKELLDDLRQSKCVLVGLGESFTIKNPEEGLYLPGVVSRKKQLVPALALALQQDKES